MDSYIAFRSRDYRLLIAATGFANLGLQMLSVAVSWDLYIQTHDARVLGNVGLVQVIPALAFAILAGYLADRYKRRITMLTAQCLTAATSLLLATGLHGVAAIYVCLFLITTARMFQWPIRQAMLPEIVPPEALSNAITWNSVIFETANVGGPAVAGFIVAASGSHAVYVAQSVIALFVLVCLARLNFERRTAIAPDAATHSNSAFEGLRFIRGNKLILSAISLDLFAVLFGGATALLPIYAVDILHAGPRAFGWLRAAPSVGAISMALFTAHRRHVRRAGRMLLWCVAGFGAATVVFGLSRSIGLSFLMLTLTGVFDNVSVVLRQSVLQTKTPDAVRGRVMAVNSIFVSCSNQIGAVESGWTAAWFGPVGSVVGGGVAAIAVVGAIAFLSPALRRWEQ